MKSIVFCAALLGFSAVNAQAAYTCWYNPSGQLTGPDGADPRFPVNQVTVGGGPGVSTDYSWGYTQDGAPSDCPKTLPANFNAAQSKDRTGVYLYTGKLTAAPGQPTSLQVPTPGGGYVTIVPCIPGTYDPTALARLAGKIVTVSGRYSISSSGGKFCATGFVGP
jgi:hypothetical protein